MEQYYIIRAKEAGVFFGQIENRKSMFADCDDVRTYVKFFVRDLDDGRC